VLLDDDVLLDDEVFRVVAVAYQRPLIALIAIIRPRSEDQGVHCAQYKSVGGGRQMKEIKPTFLCRRPEKAWI